MGSGAAHRLWATPALPTFCHPSLGGGWEGGGSQGPTLTLQLRGVSQEQRAWSFPRLVEIPWG